jgi:hypothetical protein
MIHPPPLPVPPGLAASDFRRPGLNLVLLLDVSGSMGAPFDSYYYDSATGEQKSLGEPGEASGLGQLRLEPPPRLELCCAASQRYGWIHLPCDHASPPSALHPPRTPPPPPPGSTPGRSGGDQDAGG